MSSTLEVPKGKKARPKSPRRKAPTAPGKKKKDNKDTNSKEDKVQVKAQDKDKPTATDTLAVPGTQPSGSRSPGKDEKKASRKRPGSARSDGYSSILEEMVGMGDMVLLEEITEDSIINNLIKRYAAGEIYVCETTAKIFVCLVARALTGEGCVPLMYFAPSLADLHRSCGGLGEPLSGGEPLHPRACGGVSEQKCLRTATTSVSGSESKLCRALGGLTNTLHFHADMTPALTFV